MNRAAWTVAWRHTRRRFKPGPKDEAMLLDAAERELGRRLTLIEQGHANRCMWARRFQTEGDYFRRLRTERFYALADLCRARWEREIRAESNLTTEGD